MNITIDTNIKPFEDYEPEMPLQELKTFAKYGFIAYQIHQQLNLNFIQTTPTPRSDKNENQRILP